MTINDNMDPDHQRQMKAQTNLIARIVATAAIWSIAMVIGYRLKHPMVFLTLGALAAGITILIWVQPSNNR